LEQIQRTITHKVSRYSSTCMTPSTKDLNTLESPQELRS